MVLVPAAGTRARWGRRRTAARAGGAALGPRAQGGVQFQADGVLYGQDPQDAGRGQRAAIPFALRPARILSSISEFLPITSTLMTGLPS